MAGVDRRELILVRIMELLATLTPLGMKTVARDRGEVPPAGLPAALLLDGKEELRTEIKGYQHTEMPAAQFTLLCQIFVILALRENVDNATIGGKPAPVGPELSLWRNRIIKAVAQDQTLVALCSPSGQVEYRGCYTDMEAGAPIGALGAQLGLTFAFTYTLDPAQLP